MLKNMQNWSVRFQVLIPVAILLVVLIAFVTIYFPSEQTAHTVDQAHSQARTLSEMVAFTSGAALNDGNIALVQAAFEWAKEDPNLTLLSIVDQDGNEIITHNPESYPFMAADVRAAGGLLEKGDYITLLSPISYDGNNFGEVALVYSMAAFNSEIWQTTLVVLLFGLLALVGGIGIIWFIAGGISANLAEVRDAADEVAEGNLDVYIRVDNTSEIGHLAEAINGMVSSLKTNQQALETSAAAAENSITQINAVAVQLKQGRTSARANLKGVEGQFKEMLEGFNQALDILVHPFVEAAGILQQYATGELNKTMAPLPGEQVVLSESINRIQESLRFLADEALQISKGAAEGNLRARGNTGRLQGRYRDIIEGMNHTFENLTTPVNEALQCLSDMSRGKLTTAMKGNYLGDFEKLKSAVNSTSRAMNELLVEVLIASEQVNAGARQISDSSQALSTGATEQASSLQEISASMDQVAEQTRMNASNAKAANQLSNTAAQFAGSGNDQMRRMLGAMEEINQASNAISQIIKSIDEIAFQTNLLALNAAVEAARAGIHGKGFAVVAEEVRNLAQRSAKAAKETTQLIENTVQRVSNGQDIAKMTAESLDKIVVEVEKVKNLVGDITHASESQSEGIQQISVGLTQIDKVTQSNTATAEETASASQELSSQASLLEEKLSRFELSRKFGGNPSPAPAVGRKANPWQQPAPPVAAPPGATTDEGDIFIDLEDSDFSEF